MSRPPLNTTKKLRYRCEACGAFLHFEEIEDDNSHAKTEYGEDGAAYPVLCGPVILAEWKN